MKKITRISCSCLALCVGLLALSSGLFAQDEPEPDIPVVVSRDESVERPASTPNPNRGDVRETAANRSDTIVLPREMDTSTARTQASPYSINLTEAQQKLILYLDILTKVEARAEGLRSKLFEMVEKENRLKSQITQTEYGLRPEQIQNSAALSGSLRPEEIRIGRQKVLESERDNMMSLLREIERSRRTLESAVVSADRLVERVRARFEDFVDKALVDEIEN